MMWDMVRESLQDILPESEYTLWIQPLICQRQDERVLELAGPDRFFCSWVRDRYLDTIKNTLHNLCENPITVSLNVAGPLQLECNKSGQLRLPGVHNQKSQYRSLHPGYTFEQFMVGQSNMLARTACHALANNEKTFGNCLYINSSTGLGKSHLTQAVVHSVMDSAPTTMLHYLTAQQFSAEMVNGIMNKTMEQFSQKYIHNCDMLLVEDVHTLVGKTKTQEQLNNVLDYLIKSGKRVILTAAVAPRKLDGIDEDFKSRMTSGLVTKIDAPDYATRVSIVRHKTIVNNLKLDDSLIDYLAQNLKGDIRKTESAIIGIKAKACLLDSPPDKAMIREVLDEIVGSQSNLNGELIRSFVGNQFNVRVEELKSRSRKRSVAFPRQIGMYLTRKFTEISLAEIGELYNRDHSTVLHAIRVVTRDMSRNSSVKEQVEILSNKLQNS